MAASYIVVEDSPHHGSFWLVDLVAGRAGVTASHAPVSVGDLGEDGLSGVHLVELATPLTLRHDRLLVLCDDALHLHQQPGLGIVIEGRSVGEANRDPEAGQLVEDQHLVGEVAGQAIGGEHPDPLEHPRLSLVTQGVKSGAIKARPGVALVDEAGDQLVADLTDLGLEHGDLRVDRLAGGLGLRGHAGVDGCSHRLPSFALLVSWSV